jgi:hypothetical protein
MTAPSEGSVNLADGTKISSRTRRECVQFYRRFPILSHGAKFKQAHYRVFCLTMPPPAAHRPRTNVL